MTKQQRKIYIDVVKTIAIIGVVLIHISANGYNYDIGSFNFTSAVFWGSLSRASVPLFFMSSGALMLNTNKELPLKKLYTHNILRLVVALFVWASIYIIYHIAVEGIWELPVIIQGIKDLLLFKHEFHLYYLHIILLVYAFLPVVRLFLVQANKKDLEYLLVLWFIFAILYPTLKPFKPFSLLNGIPAQWLMNMSYGAIGYCVLGYYLNNYKFSVTKSVVLAIVGFAIVFCVTLFISFDKGELYTALWEGMSVGVAVMATGIFSLCSHIGQQNIPLAKVFTFVSSASFCVYLVHILIMWLLMEVGLSVDILPTLISIPLLSGITMFFSFLVYLILKSMKVKYII